MISAARARWLTDACLMPKHGRKSSARGRVAAVDHEGLDLAGAVAAEGGGGLVFGRLEAGDALLEGREFDHHEAMEFFRTFHDLKASAARQHLGAVFGEDRRQRIGVFLVFDRIEER